MTSWVALVYALSKAERRADALDMVYDNMDEILFAQDWELADKILDEFNMSAVPVSVLLSLLVVTRPWKNRLLKREDFFHRLRVYLTATDPEHVDKLLTGL